MNIWKSRDWTPMLLKQIDKPFNSKDYIFELKFDGTRSLIFANTESVIIKNRKNMDVTYLYPELQNIKKSVKTNVIFDGEIVCFENGLPSFKKLQERAHLKNKDKILYQMDDNPVIFVCFDILYENKNLIDLPLIERKKILDKYKNNDIFVKTKYIFNNGIKLFKETKKNNLEGIVAKEKNSLYQINTRSDVWIKIKNLITEEFIVCGYIEEDNNFVISLVLGEKINNELYYVGRVTMGKKNKLYKELKKLKTLKLSPFKNYYDKNVVLVEPIKTCKVKYIERTESNSLRQPIFDKKV